MSLQKAKQKQNLNNRNATRKRYHSAAMPFHSPISQRRKQNYSVISMQSMNNPVQSQIGDLIEDFGSDNNDDINYGGDNFSQNHGSVLKNNTDVRDKRSPQKSIKKR